MTTSQSDFFIKQGDRLPVLARTLTWNDGVAIDLTACTVRWKMRVKTGGDLVIDAVATIVSAIDGKVEYAWETADTDTEGHFVGEWQVTYPDGKRLTVPTLNFVTVHVHATL